ncbi:MAG: DEAD/DEAH box helicase family protein [Rhodanobacteraceae bacterium]|jgi:type III restriction enzyme|nr:DEAD/DEAH box helicase family protein [Rhodanobacteraceae bacterium]
MALQLKRYQQDALDALAAFLAGARGCDTQARMQAAFEAARRQAMGENAPLAAYRPFTAEQPAIPVACIRIPTGGGKTLMAAHAIDIAARDYVGTRAPIALWLVPSNTIRMQTLEALKTPGHPYRQALLAHWPDDALTVLDIADCRQIRAHDIGRRAIVVVGTVQTLRVENTAAREVYAYHEDFAPHFATAPDAPFFERVSERDLEAQPYLSRGDLGRIKASFANLLAWHRPIVIMDEAHNAQSKLSLAVLERIRPACVVEWTATPLPDQNVLYAVSAQELKAADMIKLPIVLAPHPNWQEAVRDAVLTREKLAAEAASESEYLRPIVLLQADQKSGAATVDVVKAYLVDQLHVDANRIAVATGAQRELDGVDLFRRDCPIDFVITVEALKEGWDCSFAYVFCTVQNIRSAKDMEQLLGRVLRMPYAKRRASDKLNRAYAQVCGARTAEVANQLADRLISMGFERLEAAQAVQPTLGDDLFALRPVEPAKVETEFEAAPELARALAAVAPAQVRVEPVEGGAARVTVTGAVDAATVDAIVAASPKREREALREQLQRHEARVLAAAAPSERGEVFAPIPQLVLPVQGELRLYEPELLAELADYSLAGLPADLPGFKRAESLRPYLIDIERGRLGVREDSAQYDLGLDGGGVVRREDVIRALDARLRSAAVLQPDMIAWLGRLLDGLQREGFEPAYLLRHLNDLAEAAAARLRELLAAQRDKAFQQSLLPGDRGIRLDGVTGFHFDPQRYPARWLYAGRWRFGKHYYPLPGELKPDIDAEETACAIAIDGLPQVRRWVRNLERQPDAAFWLPTSSDRFYPDFVAELTDGRLFVVEYKGSDRVSNDDSREKDTIGKVWAAASGRRCLFLMATDAKTAGRPVSVQLREAVGS